MLVRYLHGACYEIGTPSTSDIYLASFDHIWAGTVSEQRFENDSGSFAGGINFYRKRSVLQPDIFILPVHCIYGRICSKQIQKEEHEYIYFVNPYQAANVFYLFQSLGHVEAPELQPLSLETWDAPCIVLGLVTVFIIFLIMCISPEIDYYRLFLLMGFGFLAFTCKRNLIFLIPAMMLVWNEVCRAVAWIASRIKDKWTQSIPRIQKMHQLAKLVLILTMVFLGFFWEIKLTENIFLTGDIRKQVYAMKNDGDLLQYFDNHGIDLDGTTIWPGNPALEMFGAKVLLEPRLEISDSAINHHADLYTEFKQVIGSYRQEQIDDYFSRYQFDYFIVDKGSKMDLYFQTHSSYQTCMETDEIVLYRNAE